jgi:uncharacterized protein (DUF1697 family)
MKTYIALLRAVNVGGTGKLPTSALKRMCEEVGLTHVCTYIASGNVVFKSDAEVAEIKSTLEGRLQAIAGKPIGVLVRSAGEMAAVLARKPFPGEPGNRTVVCLLMIPFLPMGSTVRPDCGESSFGWGSAKSTFSIVIGWRTRACASPRGTREPPAT